MSISSLISHILWNNAFSFEIFPFLLNLIMLVQVAGITQKLNIIRAYNNIVKKMDPALNSTPIASLSGESCSKTT